MDFEKRIAKIYQKYRSEKEIIDQFDLLQKELDEQISSKLLSTRETLLANFDDEVVDKLKIRGTAWQPQSSRLARLVATRHCKF